jgi:hypothetical protein
MKRLHLMQTPATLSEDSQVVAFLRGDDVALVHGPHRIVLDHTAVKTLYALVTGTARLLKFDLGKPKSPEYPIAAEHVSDDPPTPA